LSGKLARFGIHILAVGMAGFLILAWVLTGPLFQLAERFAHREKLKIKH
jgi:hypothetical protein